MKKEEIEFTLYSESVRGASYALATKIKPELPYSPTAFLSF
jgi:hypothetical protein